MSPKRITSAVYAAFTVVAAAFVLTSTWQIASAVLAEPASGAATPPRVPLGAACADGVRSLAVAVDRGVAAAAGSTDVADAERRYRAARSPEWDEARQRDLALPCAAEPRGLDAVAAVTRLDRAAEGAIRHQVDELGPVRRAVDSFIR